MKIKILKTLKKMLCPPATQDIEMNTRNRDATTKNFNYGPQDVNKSLCGNCVAFDISPRMDECMPGPVSDGDGRLGYCWMHHFKCHSKRSCHTWAKGGPIKKDKISKEWQRKYEK